MSTALTLAGSGRNVIARARSTSPWLLLANQLKSPIVALLIVATAVSAALGDRVDAIAIGAIVVLNAAVGFVQEYRAERAVLALRSLTAPRARVLRDGRSVVIPAADVTLGDVLVLEAGDIVAADARLLEEHDLSTIESALTGESAPVEKAVEPVASDAPLAERRDQVFMGTSVATGTALAQVTAIGMASELGKIARLLATVRDEPTPLQRRLAYVGHVLLWACLAIVVVVAGIGLVRGRPASEVFFSGVSLAIAAVPEGLAAVVTIALAVGVQRMAARNVLVRRLPAVETLGTATVICTDKTGTLTTGVMTVREVWGHDPDAVLAAAAACSDAELNADGRTGVGDPTEIAILAAAAARDIDRATIERERPRVTVEPFDARRKSMAIRRADGVLYVKGAIEVIAPQCRAGDVDGALAEAHSMAGRGLRVLAVAAGADALTMLGVLGIADPPRTEAIDAIAAARASGITTVMITGDHPTTARAIAREMGLVLPGEDERERVHARATPEDKLDIVRAWKRRGAVVAMTGDGVNDAPALREADIGIAMGRTGTEVTREAADMVLTDDDYASIVAAVREGRGIFENIRKTLVYLLTGNAGELALMLAAAIAGLPLPLLPLALLWINLMTDGLPALALATDAAEGDLMQRPPRRVDEPMLGVPEWRRIAIVGLVEATLVLAVYAWALEDRDLHTARALAFATLVFSELFRAFAARSTTLVFFEVGALTNLRLVAVVALSLAAQLAIHAMPSTRALFELGPLAATDLALALAVGVVPVTLLEVAKLLRRIR